MASFINRIFCGSGSVVASARALYARIVEQSRAPAFYTYCGVQDTATGRFEVLALHIFLVMHRLRDEAACKRLARTLSEESVLDLDRNLREMGVGDLSVGKKVKYLTESLYGRMAAYSDGLTAPDGSLAEALRRTMFAEDSEGAGRVDEIADYMRREAAALARQPTDQFLDGRVEFGAPPGKEQTV